MTYSQNIANNSTTQSSCHNRNDLSVSRESFIATVLTRPKQGIMTFVVDVDTTGSSEAFQVGIPKTFQLIGEEIRNIVRDVSSYLITHGDLDEGQENVLHVDGGSIDEVGIAIDNLAYAGGGDPHEHHLDAIEFILDTIPFDPRGHSAILSFITDDTKSCQSGKSVKELGEELLQRNIKLFLICQPTPTLNKLVTIADGFMFPISNNPTTTEYESITNQLSQSMTASIRCGHTIPSI